MKAYLVTTGLIFGVITVLHIWKATAEWTPNLGYVALTVTLIAIPAALSGWAWSLLRKM